MAGYTRVDTINNIADGNVINAADLDGEFDGIQAAFNSSTGHNHDGTAGEGAPILALGPAQDVTISASVLGVKTTNTVDLGTTGLKFKDFYLAGNASIGGTLAVTGVATLTAQPVLSSLTASQAVFTDASKGLVSNAITGTGSVVMSASPTLTGTAGFANITASGTLNVTGVATLGNGAILGTPASGTVTNLTGTASININGTVGATTASTGAFTTLSATGVTTVQAGTAAAPAITTTGDTNTGIFFPAADTIAFSEGGAEAARFDSAGNFGLGVTPSAWGGGVFKVFQLGGGGSNISAVAGADEQIQVVSNAYYDGSAYKYVVTQHASRYVQTNSTHTWETAPSGTAGNAITFTQALTLDASGNLLAGKTSTATTAEGAMIGKDSSGCYLTLGYTGTGTVNSTAFFRGTSGSLTQVGSISTTGSATAYNTSSDYRLKNITGPITNSGAYIDSLNPVEGTWKTDGSTFVGLIAHEVQEASRTQVATGTKDGAEMQGMDYSASELIANLIAEVKSLRQRVATLEAK